jgi:hypothetical protein
MKPVHAVVLFLGSALIVTSIVGFFYTLFTNGDWKSYPVMAAFVSVGGVMLYKLARPPVQLEPVA